MKLNEDFFSKDMVLASAYAWGGFAAGFCAMSFFSRYLGQRMLAGSLVASISFSKVLYSKLRERIQVLEKENLEKTVKIEKLALEILEIKKKLGEPKKSFNFLSNFQELFHQSNSTIQEKISHEFREKTIEILPVKEPEKNNIYNSGFSQFCANGALGGMGLGAILNALGNGSLFHRVYCVNGNWNFFEKLNLYRENAWFIPYPYLAASIGCSTWALLSSKKQDSLTNKTALIVTPFLRSGIIFIVSSLTRAYFSKIVPSVDISGHGIVQLCSAIYLSETLKKIKDQEIPTPFKVYSYALIAMGLIETVWAFKTSFRCHTFLDMAFAAAIVGAVYTVEKKAEEILFKKT